MYDSKSNSNSFASRFSFLKIEVLFFVCHIYVLVCCQNTI
jgi:hypothetical protein